MAKREINGAELAMKYVFHINDAQVKEPKYQEIKRTALKAVWTNPEFYPGENEILRDERLDLDGPSRGDFTELAKHLLKVFGDDLSDWQNATSYEVVFEVYRRMLEAGTDNANADIQEITEPLGSVEASSLNIQNNNIISNKEVTNMGNVLTPEEILNKVQQDAETPVVSKPGATGATEGDAIKNMISGERDKRLSNYEQVKIVGAIVAQPRGCDRVVDPKPMGTIPKVETKLKDFMTKFVESLDENGNPTFKPDVIGAGEIENAKRVYQALLEAKEDPTKEFEAKVPTNFGTPKGFLILKNADGTPEAMNPEVLRKYLFKETIGMLKTEGDAFVELDYVRNMNKDANKPAATDAIDQAASVPVVKARGFSKIAEAEQAAFYKTAKIVDQANKEPQAGFYIKDLSFKYKKPAKDGSNKTRTLSYRIPLNVMQYKLIKSTDESIAAFASEGLKGNVKEAIDSTNKSAVEKQLTKLAELVSAAFQADTDITGMGEQVQDVVNKANDDAKAAQAGLLD